MLGVMMEPLSKEAAGQQGNVPLQEYWWWLYNELCKGLDETGHALMSHAVTSH